MDRLLATAEPVRRRGFRRYLHLKLIPGCRPDQVEHATGTHRGAFLGVPATGRAVRFHGIEIVRIERGKIVERWGEWDGIGLLEQLGALGGTARR